MGKKKLTKYQWLVTLFLMLVYSLTVQIVARPLLTKQVLHNGSAISTSSTTLLFWLNLIVIFVSLLMLLFQAIIYRIIATVLGTNREYSIGYSIFLLTIAVLPLSIVEAVATLIFHQDNLFSSKIVTNSISSVLSVLIYSLGLKYMNIITKKQLIVLSSILIILNIIMSLIGGFSNPSFQ